MHAKRSLGQNFLVDPQFPRRIVEAVAPRPGETIVEIGPGHGALTELLVARGARVVAVELDRELIAPLGARFPAHPDFRLLEADALGVDFCREIAPAATARVVANLPYYVSTPILRRLIAQRRCLSEMTLMLQREVVTRLVAPPGGKVYGSLSMVAQYFTEPRAVMNLAPGSFSPPPAVSSTVVSMPFLSPRELSADAERDYPPFVRMLFAHRRRTLLNNLKSGGCSEPEEALHRAGIDASRRPETLDRTESLALFAAWASLDSKPMPGGS